MEKGNEKKKSQRGMPHGTASNRLRKAIIFDMANRLGETNCFQCGKEIDNIDNFSIEHKIPYLNSDDPYGLFFSLENIAFSHIRCNIAAARRTTDRKHPSVSAYRRGCRCDECRELCRCAKAQYRLRMKNSDSGDG